MVAQLVARPVRVDDDDVDVRLDERRVVVASVPEDDVGLLLRLIEDLRVVDAGKDQISLGDVRLVLLALLDRRVGRLEVLVALEALGDLLRQVSVRHGVAEDGDALSALAEQRRDMSSGLALAAAGADGADGDHRLRRRQHRVVRRQQPEARSGCERARRDVHHVLVGHVGIGEDDLVDALVADQGGELVLRPDRDALRVEVACQLGGIDATVDVRDLRRRERDDLVLLTASVNEVEVVEVAAGGPRNHYSRPRHVYGLCT